MPSSEPSNPLDEKDVPCSMEEHCGYSPANAGELKARCQICCLSPDNKDRGFPVYWKPTVKGLKHPGAEALKRQASRDRRQARVVKRQDRDKDRQSRLRQASRAEKNTERKMIRATKNSGRSFQDGDHVAAGQITLDTKMQSRRIHPVVNLIELAKVRKDAARAGNLFGALVLRPKNNSGIVALAEEDFARLIRILVMHEETDERKQASTGRNQRAAETPPAGLPDPDGVCHNPSV